MSVSKPRRKRRSGYFCVSTVAIDAILDAHLTADHILTFLVVAGFSYSNVGKAVDLLNVRQRKDGALNEYLLPSSQFIRLSNASAKAIEEYAGVSRKRAKECLNDLRDLRTLEGERLLFTVADWNAYARSFPSGRDELKIGTLHPKKQPKGLPFVINKKDNVDVVRFVLNSFAELNREQVWLPKELISGLSVKSPSGVLSLPLRALNSLRMYKDEAARLLLAAYRYRNYGLCGYVDPVSGFSIGYQLQKIADIKEAVLWRASAESFEISPSLSSQVVGDKSVSGDAIFKQLSKLGFFYCDVVVLIGSDWYVLSNKSLGNIARKNQLSSAYQIEDAIREEGYKVAEDYGKGSYRFRSGYPVLSLVGDSLSVKGLLVPRIDLKGAIPEQDDDFCTQPEHYDTNKLFRGMKGIRDKAKTMSFVDRKRLLEQ